MKQLLFFCALVLSVFSVHAQTNTWTGAVNQNWSTGGNWTLGLPTDTHDVVIPTGSTVNMNTSAAINSIDVQGTVTINMTGTIDFIATSTFSSGTMFNWNSGTLTGGGTLTNNGTMILLTSSNKSIAGGTVLNNAGTLNVAFSGDLYIADGVLNNQLSGTIDMQAESGNLSYSGVGSHILNNFGLIKKTTPATSATINCDLINSGTLQVEAGTMALADIDIKLNGGVYNVSTGAILEWDSTLTVTGTLTGLVNGTVAWTGTVTVPTAAQWNFTGTGNINWSAGTLNGGGTATNNFVMNLSTSANKSLAGATTFNNIGTINMVFSGDLYVSDGVLNNQPTGVIDLQAVSGNLSYSGAGSHVMNNYGLIKRTTAAGLAIIDNVFHNEGTIWVQSGTLNLNNVATTLQNGIYNVDAGTFLTWNGTVALNGTLTGNIPGEIVWYDTVRVEAANSATLAFTGSGNVNWTTGTITGGGSLTNQFTMRLTTSANKSLTGGTTFNNAALIYNQSSGDLYVADGIFNNLSNGTIDLRADAGNLSYSGAGSHILNNSGLIKRTTTTGTVTIESDLINTGTISIESGTLVLADVDIQLNGGTYNVAAGTTFEWQSAVTCSGTLGGLVNGTIRWFGTTAVPASATLGFTGAGFISWDTGTINGGGVLTNNFQWRLDTASNKSIAGLTTVNNNATMAMISSGDLYVADGIFNNQATGTIDLRADAGNLSYSGAGSHILNNFGLIKKTTTSGTVTIESDLTNTGTIAVESGTLVLGDVDIQLNGGTYNVSAGTEFEWQSIVTCSGTLGGLVDGTIRWVGTTAVPASATLGFTGAGLITWNTGTINGGGTLTNNFQLSLDTSSNKSLSGLTTFNNNGTMSMVFSGDLYIADGIFNNQSTGVIDLRAVSGNLSYSGSGSHVLNNFGLIKKTTADTASILCLVNNSGTIDAQLGTIDISGDHPFTNAASGIVMGVGTIDLPPLAAFTNNGIFAPGGNPGTLSLVGPFEMESSAQIAVDLNGLTPGTGHDVLVITGAAALNGSVSVNLGFAPAINDSFTVATTTGNISSCVASPTATATRNGLNYLFNVTCVDNNKLVLTVSEIEAVPPTAPDQVFCAGAIVNNLEADGQNILWYDMPAGGSPLDQDVVLISATYYVTQTIDGFESERVAVNVTVFTTPAPTAASPQVYNDAITVADLQATGTLLQWYADISGLPLASNTAVATGTYYVSQTLNGCEGPRIPIEVTVDTESFFFYVDADLDGFGTGNLVEVEDGPTPPAGYSTNNTDCDDTDETIWQSATLFTDADGDGYDAGSETVCYGATVPTGYSETTLGTDCDDADANAFQSASLFIDADGDGYDAGSETVCYGATVPTGYAETTLGTDCDDTDANIFQSASLFIDADGDGYDAGSETICYGATVPTGYSATTSGTDCDDADANAFQSASLFIDADGDGYDVGSETVCYGATVPTGYSETTSGTDCDDNNAAVNPGAAEIAGNGIDDNCNGATDEGGNITTTLTAASCGATLANINSIVGIIAVPGATAYRIRATNSATLAQQTIVRPVPNFSMTMFAAYDYAATYAIEIEVQMSAVFVGYYGPSCNISTPAILIPGGAAQITPSQCGITLANINTLIATTSLAGVTGYRFRVTNLTDASAPNQVQSIDRTLHWFSLPMLATFTYGTTYQVEVAMRTNGAYTAFGNPCTVTTPAVPSLTNCGGTVATANTFVATTSLPQVTQYRFDLTNTANSQLTTVQTPLNRFTFSQVTGYVPGQTYNVRVSVMTSGVWSLPGGVCTITAPGALPAKPIATNTNAKVWPNPFIEDFTVSVDTGNAKQVLVYDMLGRLVEQQQIEGDAESFKLGAKYPSGVYNLIVKDGLGVQTIRIVKR